MRIIGKCAVDRVAYNGDELDCAVHRENALRHLRNDHVLGRLFVGNLARRRLGHELMIILDALGVFVVVVEKVHFVVARRFVEVGVVGEKVLKRASTALLRTDTNHLR